jgi:hypothetical protein
MNYNETKGSSTINILETINATTFVDMSTTGIVFTRKIFFKVVINKKYMVYRKSNRVRQKWSHLNTERSLNWGSFGMMIGGALLEMTGLFASVGIGMQIAGAGMSFGNTGVKQRYHQLGKGGLGGSYAMDVINIVGIGGTVAAARMIQETDIKPAEEGIDFAKGKLEDMSIDDATATAMRQDQQSEFKGSKAINDREGLSSDEYLKKVNEQYKQTEKGPLSRPEIVVESKKKVGIYPLTEDIVDGSFGSTSISAKPVEIKPIEVNEAVPEFKTDKHKELYYQRRSEIDSAFRDERYKVRREGKIASDKSFDEMTAFNKKFKDIESNEEEILDRMKELSAEIARKTRVVRYAIPGVKLIALASVWGGNYKISKQYQD